MSGKAIALTAVMAVYASAALATELNLSVEALGCRSSEIAIDASCEVAYRVVGELSDAHSDGLAMIVFDLEFDGGSLPLVDSPAVLPMASFAPPAGLANPAGFEGTPIAGRLVQVGGSQNVLGHGEWPCETDDDCPAPAACGDEFCEAIPGLPLGTVVLGVAQTGAPESLVIGTVTTPSMPGTYTLRLTNPVGNVFEKGANARPYWWNDAVDIVSIDDLSITVQAGRACCDTYEACCLPDASCTYAAPDDCVALGGMPSATDCESDTDGDGADGTCGDQCPDDPDKVEPGMCGCNFPDNDTDGDGALDCMDGCPSDSNKYEPGICGCGMPDVDTDGDTVLDCRERCPGEDDLIDDDGDLVPDCLQGELIPATSTWATVLLTSILLFLVACRLYPRRRREVG